MRQLRRGKPRQRQRSRSAQLRAATLDNETLDHLLPFVKKAPSLWVCVRLAASTTCPLVLVSWSTSLCIGRKDSDQVMNDIGKLDPLQNFSGSFLTPEHKPHIAFGEQLKADLFV